MIFLHRLRTHLPILALACLPAWGAAQAQSAPMPAARQHVKLINGVAVKYTSRLTKVVELNFTMGNGHKPGKIVISDALRRIARAYGTDGKDAFSVATFASAENGSAQSPLPNFTVDDLLSGEVIVANNIGYFGDTLLGSQRQQAVQRAIEVEGRGYLGFHGSGDNNRTGWAWYTDKLHPVNYVTHGARTAGPVYKHLEESGHIVLQGVLETRTIGSEVPDETDAAGREVLVKGVPVRKMKNEWYQFLRDISRDPAYKDKVTVLLKYDARAMGSNELPDQFKRTGGNLYTYLYQVGKGMTSYIPAGHENDELLDPNTGFDGGAGDFDRYVAQSLFFLAGYRTVPCDSTCNGLPMVDARNRIIVPVSVSGRFQLQGKGAGLHMDPSSPAFEYAGEGGFRAVLKDIRGRVVEEKVGRGRTRQAFAIRGLGAGTYVLEVRIGGEPIRARLYAVLP